MSIIKDRAFSRQLETLFNLGAIRELNDGQLLERFARDDGETAELAFAALVERHGAMVLRACRSQLSDPNDAQDAFQATFLVLIEKAGRLWVRESLGPWLHQVALRTAACARTSTLRRRRIERRASELMAQQSRDDDPDANERAQRLHEEIGRLPERYRVPIVLCDLEGRTCEEAARVMGRPVGTIKCWRARGRERLRSRLIRAGLAPTVAIEAALISEAAQAVTLKTAAEQTIVVAARLLSDRMTAGVVPASVSMLVKGVIQSMYLNQLRTAFAAIGIVTALGIGLASAVQGAGDELEKKVDAPAPAASRPVEYPRPIETAPEKKKADAETWPLTLREAIRIGLENAKIVRVVRFGAEPGDSIVIAMKSPDRDHRDLLTFRAEITAAVRSMEQQYWNLWQTHAQHRAAEWAAARAQKVLDHEQSELKVGRGTVADVAEAAQRLEQFNLDLVTRTSDVITTERQLRRLLGLPAADNRRIKPVTPPIQARIEPDWKQCETAMLHNEPEILKARLAARVAEEMAGAAGQDQATPIVEQQRLLLQQAVDEKTHVLVRFILGIESGYKEMQTASRLRKAAEQRLDAQRAYYEEGRITIDRLLDAVNQYAQAQAQEAQFTATYNIAIVALEEAKGTLLEYTKIVVDAGLNRSVPGPTRSEVMTAEVLRPMASSTTEPRKPDAPAQARTEKPDADGTTYTFHLSIGGGPRPFEVKGSLTVTPARNGR